MIFKIIFITLTIILLKIHETEPKPPKSVRFFLNNVTVEDTPVVRVEYTFNKDRKVRTVDAIGHLNEELKKPILTELEFLTKLPYQEKYQTIVKLDKIEICDFFQNKAKDPIARLFYNNFMKHSNITQSCPVPKGDYYVNDLTIDTNSVPPFLVAGQHLMIVRAFYKPQNKVEPLFSVNYYSTIER